jgi:hypothetical protein
VITVTGGATTYRIKNRWQNSYLYDAGDRVRYSATASGTSYNWVLEDVGNGQRELRNVATGEYMHIENLTGYIQCTSRTSGWMSSRWTTEDAGSGFVRLKNVWQPTHYIHVENLAGHAQHGTINSAWWSAQWLLEAVTTAAAEEQMATMESTDQSLSYWPTVVHDKLNIQTDGSYETLEVIDLLGRVHTITRDLKGQRLIEVDVRHLSTGVHVVKLRSVTCSRTFRIVKE